VIEIRKESYRPRLFGKIRGRFPQCALAHFRNGDKAAVRYRLQSVAKFCKIALSMKAYVTVMLKTTVLDPQGKTIHGALKKMGYKGVGAVRQGKFFELNLDGGLDKNAAKAEVERIAKEVLTNPVIEEFTYRIEE
jgi:phosphoribosylformylglycinamidine synthase